MHAGYKPSTWSGFERWADRKRKPPPEPKLGPGITKDMLMGAGRPVVRTEQLEEIA